MARFYAEIQGNRGKASRMGSTSSGIRGHIRGWHVGISVVGEENEEEQDEFFVYATHGSSGAGSRKLIARVTVAENGELNVRLNHDTEYVA